MNPVSLGILIIKVALCTLLLVAGIRLLLLTHESFVNFVSRLFGIADLEVSPTTVKVIKVIGGVLAIGGIALAYALFGPKAPPKDEFDAYHPTQPAAVVASAASNSGTGA